MPGRRKRKLKKSQPLRAAKKVHRKRAGNNMLEPTRHDYLACEFFGNPWLSGHGVLSMEHEGAEKTMGDLMRCSAPIEQLSVR